MKYALVTGASRGIGRAVALRLANEYPVIINYHSNSESANEVKELIEANGGYAELLPFDVADSQSIENAIDLWEQRHPDDYISVLVNNAGIRRDNVMFMMANEEWNDVVNTNLNGFFYITRRLLKHMMPRKRGGRIINMSSLSGLKGMVGQVNYSTAKAALIGATKALAQEVAPRNITVNAVAPGFIHAIISALYINGASRFVGGSDKFANLLVSVIQQAGGSVITNDGVEWVEVNDRHVDFVRTRIGTEYRGDYYISAIHPCTLLKLMSENAFPKAYRNRLKAIPNAYSAFSAYIKLKPNTFPYINHSEYYMTRYDEMWNFGEHHDYWPLGFLFMTPPENHQGKYSTKVLITAPMLYDEVRRWENTTVGHRGADYEAWKEKMTKQLLERVEEMHPNFKECIDKVNASSPLTIRDFYGVKEGALSGYSKDYKNMALSQLPVVTKISNLLLTGQNNNLHGFCGVPLTAISTAEAILGKNYILNKLNQQ